MVDTIVMRVHDLRKHDALVNEIKTNFKKGTTKNTAYLTPEETESIKISETIDNKDFIDYYWNPKTGTHLIHYSSQEKLNNSGHYLLNAFVNYDRDFVEFNFSVPKYIHGTNVLMFCEHIWNKNFNYFNNSSLDFNLKKIYDRLLNFIINFFNLEFIGKDIVDFSLVEINRIDLSFNQVFDNKKFALDYLEYQKKIRKKHLRADSNSYRAWDTSLMYSTKRFSFKIYHKGTEYKKHDRKEHEKINNIKGREYFNINELQSFSDKMLRYEVTFRDSMLSYLFNHKIFRNKCPQHKANYKIYKKVEEIKAKNDLIASTTNSFPLNILREAYINKHPYLPIDKADDVVHIKMSRLLNRKRQFRLKTNKYVEEFNSTTTINSCFEPRALFSKALLLECSKFFKSQIKCFQVTIKPPESVVRERIEKYNADHFNKLPLNEMLKFFGLLKNSSFEELMKTGPYSRATFYRYKNRFEKIGLSQNNIMPIDYINPIVDLGMYHHQIIYGKNLINK